MPHACVLSLFFNGVFHPPHTKKAIEKKLFISSPVRFFNKEIWRTLFISFFWVYIYIFIYFSMWSFWRFRISASFPWDNCVSLLIMITWKSNCFIFWFIIWTCGFSSPLQGYFSPSQVAPIFGIKMGQDGIHPSITHLMVSHPFSSFNMGHVPWPSLLNDSI